MRMRRRKKIVNLIYFDIFVKKPIECSSSVKISNLSDLNLFNDFPAVTSFDGQKISKTRGKSYSFNKFSNNYYSS